MLKEINITRAKEEDLGGIKNLLRQINDVHSSGRPDLFKAGAVKYTDEQILDIIKDDLKPVFVARDEQENVLGHAFCVIKESIDSNVLTDIKTLHIDDLCVDEKLRGRHLGRKIYDHVLEYAKQIGCYNVTLNVWTCNKSAMRFYESCGLEQQKIGMEKIL